MEHTKAKFHLPGFTIHAKFNLVFLNMLKNSPEFFRDGVEIASFYDVFPPAMWNGGRPVGGEYEGKEYQFPAQTIRRRQESIMSGSKGFRTPQNDTVDHNKGDKDPQCLV